MQKIIKRFSLCHFREQQKTKEKENIWNWDPQKKAKGRWHGRTLLKLPGTDEDEEDGGEKNERRSRETFTEGQEEENGTGAGTEQRILLFNRRQCRLAALVKLLLVCMQILSMIINMLLNNSILKLKGGKRRNNTL